MSEFGLTMTLTSEEVKLAIAEYAERKLREKYKTDTIEVLFKNVTVSVRMDGRGGNSRDYYEVPVLDGATVKI